MKHHPDLRAAVARAVVRARAASRPPTVYDLFGALLESAAIHLLILRTGGDPDLLASGLSSAASTAPVPSGVARFWPGIAPDPAFGRVIALASHLAAGTKQELEPPEVFAAGFDAGDPALVALFERAGLSRTRVRQWVRGDGAENTETAVSGPRVERGFLSALAGRLTWRVSLPDEVSSSDGVIAGSGTAAFVVWLAYDRYAAGSSAYLYPGGIAGLAWYAGGLLALAWVLHRVSGSLAGFRSILAPVVGCVPLALAVAVAFHRWAPEWAHRPFVILLAVAGLLHARRVLAGVGAVRPRAAILAGAAFLAIFAWGTKEAYVRPHVWFPVTEDDDSSGWASSERLLFEQADRIDAAVARVRPGDPDRPSVFFVGFAGTGDQKVFAEETKLAERVIAERYGAAGRTLLLLNDRRDLETGPLATVSGLRRALAGIAKRMDRSKDVLFLFLTSHGSAKPYLAVSNETWPLEQLDPAGLRSALDASGIKWRVIVISACHSGAFIPALASEDTAIFTAAAADRASFGCSDDRDVTEFGRAFIQDALPRSASLVAAFRQARAALAAEERQRNVAESLPQASIGAAMSAHWDRVEAEHVASVRPNE